MLGVLARHIGGGSVNVAKASSGFDRDSAKREGKWDMEAGAKDRSSTVSADDGSLSDLDVSPTALRMAYGLTIHCIAIPEMLGQSAS